MPKLYFRYGTVGCAKTMCLLTVAHTYEVVQEKKICCIKPATDTRFGKSLISSRTGLKREADVVVKDVSDLKAIESELRTNYVCLLVDEVQFFDVASIDMFRDLACNVPVICYGLRTDFQTKLFPATERLMAICDNIEEIITTCIVKDCAKKALFNLRHQNGYKISDGPQILQGAEELYSPVCYRHYKEFPSFSSSSSK